MADPPIIVTSQPAVPPASPFASLFGLNLISLIFLGSALSIWLLYYTDLFPEVAGILTLAGAATWAGFLVKLLKEDRIKELQAWTDRTLFAGSRTLAILAFFTLFLLIAGSFVGSLQLEPLQESLQYAVQIHPPGKTSSDFYHLMPGGQLRWIGFTTFWSHHRAVVKVSGYPETEVEFRPWQRVSVYVPGSLLRPVILLRPSIPLIDAVRGTSLTLRLVIQDTQLHTTFDGHAIWIGADSDILVPKENEAAWRQELAGQKSTRRLEFWLPPLAPPEFNVRLQAGQVIEATLLKNDHSVYTTIRFAVLPLRSNREFVQEVLLDVPVITN